MSDADFDLGAPELAPEDLLRIEDPYFSPETVAIVTGAASGIGRTTAVALAANGLTVVGADIDGTAWRGQLPSSTSSTSTASSSNLPPT